MLFNKLGDIGLILFLDELRALTLSCLQKNQLGFIAWWLLRVLFKYGCQMYWHFFVAKVSFISFCLSVFESLKSFLKVCLISLFFVFRFFCVQSLKKNVVLFVKNVKCWCSTTWASKSTSCNLHTSQLMSKCWGFVVVNNGWLVDLLKLQVLQCIIGKFEPASSNALTGRFFLLLWVLLCKLHMQNCLLRKNNLETRR